MMKNSMRAVEDSEKIRDVLGDVQRKNRVTVEKNEEETEDRFKMKTDNDAEEQRKNLCRPVCSKIKFG